MGGLIISESERIDILRQYKLILEQKEVAPSQDLIQNIIGSLADDLNTPLVIEMVNAWVDQTNAGGTAGDMQLLINSLDALLGIKL